MDHEVEDHIHIRAPDGERRCALRRDITGRFQQRLDRRDRGIESFDMSNLQDHILTGRKINKFIGLVDGFGYGFLEKNVDALFQKLFCYPMVQNGRRHDAYGVHPARSGERGR